jgi:hypothetical protein
MDQFVSASTGPAEGPPIVTEQPASEIHAEEDLVIDLGDRNLAALLAWLWPGAGHLYQRRVAKGLLFMVCILGTFIAGMYLGEGKVVYAAWGPKPEHRRLYYLLQLGVGLPALPALVQAAFDRPLGSFMAPPVVPHAGRTFVADGKEYDDELSMWNLEIELFEIGTIYTVIAGLLNVLAIYDAWGGPVIAVSGKRKSDGDSNAQSDAGQQSNAAT